MVRHTFLALVMVLSVLHGCGPEEGLPRVARPQATPGVWHPAPDQMRIYPATRFVQDQGQLVLEARIELLDAMGDSIKGAGRFHFELIGPPHLGRSVSDRKLYSWDVPLLSLEDQQRAYDRVTRTYLFRLKMDQKYMPRGVATLKAVLMPSAGDRLEAQAKLPEM